MNPFVNEDSSWWTEACPGDGKTLVSWGMSLHRILLALTETDKPTHRRKGIVCRRRRGALPTAGKGEQPNLALVLRPELTSFPPGPGWR